MTITIPTAIAFALTAFLTFAAEIMLINHRHYAFAVPGMVVLAALVPALLAGPI